MEAPNFVFFHSVTDWDGSYDWYDDPYDTWAEVYDRAKHWTKYYDPNDPDEARITMDYANSSDGFITVWENGVLLLPEEEIIELFEAEKKSYAALNK